MAFTPEDLRPQLPPLKPGQTLWVALSGGLDSTVLLHALVALELPLALKALHVNHQISPNANTWEAHCLQLCEHLGVELVAEKVAVQSAGRGLEDAARAARYRVFHTHVQAGDCLCTAHHQDDQSETLLLRLLRGAGPRGLAAMARERPLGDARLLRPLLSVSRADLEAYARAQHLRWVEDESNGDTDYDRNYLRQTLIPLFRQRWPAFDRRLGLTARLCGESELLLEELAAMDLAVLDARPERLGQSLSLPALMTLSRPRRHNVLRYWLRQQGMDVPEQQHLEQLETQLSDAREDGEVCIRWAGQSLRPYRQRMYALPALVDSENWPSQSFSLSDGESLQLPLPAGGCLALSFSPNLPTGGGLRSMTGVLRLDWRQGGERCQPEGRAHSQTLKKLLQEYGLEPWWRDRLPLLYCGDQLVAVGDLWVCKGFAADRGQPGYQLHWQL